MILYNFDVYSFFPDFTDDFRIGSGVGDDQIDLIKAVDADETVAFELAVITQKNGSGELAIIFCFSGTSLVLYPMMPLFKSMESAPMKAISAFI